jgi:hypothetical protein
MLGVELFEQLPGGNPFAQSLAPDEIRAEDFSLHQVLAELALGIGTELLAVNEDVNAVRHRGEL